MLIYNFIFRLSQVFSGNILIFKFFLTLFSDSATLGFKWLAGNRTAIAANYLSENNRPERVVNMEENSIDSSL